MNIFWHFHKEISNIIERIYSLSEQRVGVELPKNKDHGDLATNIALVLKNVLNRDPRSIAEEIKAELIKLEGVVKVDIAGPGFINITCGKEFWQDALKTAMANWNLFVKPRIGNNEKINIEFVSANPTGPMHIGHMRQAVVGDSLANILQFVGYDVTREFYINDNGGQIINTVATVFERYKQALGEAFEIKEGMYPGEYLISVGKELAIEQGRKLLDLNAEELFVGIRKFTVKLMLKLIKRDLTELGVQFDIFFSEKENLHDKNLIQESLNFLKSRGLIYQGVLEPPKGKMPEDYEPREQTLFRATQFGDEVDRPLVKSDGSYAYFAADIAYHKNKLDRGFKEMILVLGADHGGYIKRITAAVKALSEGEAKIEVLISQMVSLIRDGEQVKMSKRSGSYVTLEEVVEEVGRDVARFVMLTRKNDSALEFDFDKVVEQSKDNPVFYVQYANARANSVLRQVEERKLSLVDPDFSLLTHEKDIELIKQICKLPNIIEAAANVREPHRITYYLIELANIFHSYWAIGNSSAELRFIIEDNQELTSAKIALVKAVLLALKTGLSLLGIEPVAKM